MRAQRDGAIKDALVIHQSDLQRMLEDAAQRGAERAIDDMVCYHLKDACGRLGISYNTLKRRIMEGKIRPIDGRITGAELRRYLSQHVGD